MAITHTKVSAVADGGDTDLVRPVDWNAAHTGQPTSISDFLEGTPTEDLATKAPTSEWAFDHNASSQISSKVKAETRDMTAASGDVAYTGYGFQPTSLIIFAIQSSGVGRSWGMSDSSIAERCIARRAAETNFAGYSNIVEILENGSTVNYVYAVVKTYDADGFTLTWTKLGNPTATIYFCALAFR